MSRRAPRPPLEDPAHQVDQQRITWREFLLLCGTMYRQVLPGMLLLVGVILLLIIFLLRFTG